MSLKKDVLKICSKFAGEHPYRSVISKKLLCNFIEIALRHGCSPVNLLHIFRTPFPRNTSGRLLLIHFILHILLYTSFTFTITSARLDPNPVDVIKLSIWCVTRFGTICTILKTWKILMEEAWACNFTKRNTPPWVCFTSLKLYKWYQIA